MCAFSTDSPECKGCPLHDDCNDKRIALCRVMNNAYAPVVLPNCIDVNTTVPTSYNGAVISSEEIREAIRREILGGKPCSFKNEIRT